MSDYRYMKVIRCKVNLDKSEVPSLWNLEDKFPDLFDISLPQHFEKAVVEEDDYLDYVIESKIDDNSGDWGKSRYLTDNEANKFLPLFKQMLPDIKKDNLRAVEFCWYDCSEAPLYYDVSEEEWI